MKYNVKKSIGEGIKYGTYTTGIIFLMSFIPENIPDCMLPIISIICTGLLVGFKNCFKNKIIPELKMKNSWLLYFIEPFKKYLL